MQKKIFKITRNLLFRITKAMKKTPSITVKTQISKTLKTAMLPITKTKKDLLLARAVSKPIANKKNQKVKIKINSIKYFFSSPNKLFYLFSQSFLDNKNNVEGTSSVSSKQSLNKNSEKSNNTKVKFIKKVN